MVNAMCGNGLLRAVHAAGVGDTMLGFVCGIALFLVIGFAVAVVRKQRNPRQRKEMHVAPEVDRTLAGTAQLEALRTTIRALDVDGDIKVGVINRCIHAHTWSGSYLGAALRSQLPPEEGHRIPPMRQEIIKDWTATMKALGLSPSQVERLVLVMPWAASDFLEVDAIGEVDPPWAGWYFAVATRLPHRESAILAARVRYAADANPIFARLLTEPRATEEDVAAAAREFMDPSAEFMNYVRTGGPK